MIRVVLPFHLRSLIKTDEEVTLPIEGSVGIQGVLDALEARYPVLRGTLRDHATRQRRPFIRFFACKEDLTHLAPDVPLPGLVLAGEEPLFIVGAMAGG